MSNTELVPTAPAEPISGSTAIALRPKVEHFAQLYAAHGNASKAYREAFEVRPDTRPGTVWQNAYDLVHDPQVAERVRQLLAQAAEHATISARARMVHLQSIVEADPGELVRIASECCRRCHGVNHAHQWVDFAEYLAALSAAIAKNEKRAARRQRETPLPSDEGGYGFDPNREPAEDCPQCYGRGTQRVIITDTHKLSPSARALLKSIRQKPNGEVEVQLHDKLAASDQLNRMQGTYIDRSVNVNINAHVEPLRDMTPAEIAELIQQQKQLR
jgi:phage terminase small subunit